MYGVQYKPFWEHVHEVGWSLWPHQTFLAPPPKWNYTASHSRTMYRYNVVFDDPLPLRDRVNVPARSRSTSVEVKGIFPGAKVIRGHDWKWKDQDGMYMYTSWTAQLCIIILYSHVEADLHAMCLYLWLCFCGRCFVFRWKGQHWCSGECDWMAEWISGELINCAES